MRIIYHLGFPIDGQSGKERASRAKIQAMRALGYEVEVISPERWWLPGPLRMLQVTAQVLAAFPRAFARRPDLIISRGWGGLAITLAARACGISVFREQHGDLADESSLLGKTAVERVCWIAIDWLDKLCLRSADGVICNHPALRRFLIRKGVVQEARSIAVYNGAAEALDEKQATELARGLPMDRWRLVFVGSISLWHGVDYVCELVPYLNQASSRPVEVLIVGGGGSAEKALLCRYEGIKHLKFVGRVTSADADRYIQSAHGCLLPVRNNRISPGSPLKLYDYIRHGKIVFGQKGVEGYGDVIEDNGIGIAVNFEDPDRASRDIVSYLSTVDVVAAATHNVRLAAGQMSWTSVVEQWLAFARSCARPSGARSLHPPGFS